MWNSKKKKKERERERQGEWDDCDQNHMFYKGRRQGCVFIKCLLCGVLYTCCFIQYFQNEVSITMACFSQLSRSVMSDSLQPYEPQHARPPCLSPTPGVYPNPCPLSRWCHPTISTSVVLFSSCPQSFPASGSFQMSQLFASGGQSIRVSASTSVLPMNTQD